LPLPWFRRKRGGEQAPEQAAAPAVIEQQSHPVIHTPPAGDAGEQTTTTPKRRRGSRGGRGRKKPGATAAGATATAVVDAPNPTGRQAASTRKPPAERSQRAEKRENAKKDAGKKDGAKRRERTPQTRRRTPPKRAPLPQAKRELLVSIDVGERRVAVLEDDRVAEVYLERPEKRSIAGNIYKGVVDNVLPGMEAAFVEIGLEKNGFLYVDEIVGPELEGRKGARKIQDLISRGQEVLVQAVKDPMKTKGARLTTEISLPGRFVVYQPHGEGLGVSRRLEDDERARLKDVVKSITPQPKGGIIVRTAAEGASAEDVERDLVFLQRLWKSIETRAKSTKAPTLVYQEAELPLRVTRDLFTGDFERALVDNDRAYKRITGYLKKTSPHMVERVIRYKEKDPLFDSFGVQAEIESTLSRRVDLPSGGYLVFDYAEAFTVIDVNTGRFVGSRSKTSGARLEDTITKNNLEAVKEVVRQLRLRDIGGIIVIDFIDMANPKNRAAVENALRTELERDRTKTYVVEISPLGLVEMTRQNVTDGPREVMTRKCPTCGGDGIVRSERTTAIELERKLRGLATPGSRSRAFRVELNAKIASLIAGSGASRLVEIEDLTKKRFFLVGKEDVHLDHFLVLEQGTLAKLQPSAPVAEGAELEVKLVEVGLHDPTAGVAKVEDYEISVAGAAKLVGKKLKVRIVRVLDGQAYAEPAQPLVTGDEPLTAEAEAEKPTRAPRKKAVAADPDAASVKESEELVDDAGEPVDEADEPVDEVEPADEAEEAGESEAEAEGDEPEAAAADGVAVKKRTRRGSRGGRRRKKKPAGAATADGSAESGDEVDEDDGDEVAEQADEEVAAAAEAPLVEPAPAKARPAPRIHVPAAAIGRTDEDASEEEEAVEVAVEAELSETELSENELSENELSENGAEPTPRKKTRRGSRGGRNRKRKPAAAANGDSAAGEPAEPIEAAEPGEAPIEEALVDVEPAPDPVPDAPAADAEPVSQAEPAEAGDPGDDPFAQGMEDFERAERGRNR
jgi:ribonuclease G